MNSVNTSDGGYLMKLRNSIHEPSRGARRLPKPPAARSAIATSTAASPTQGSARRQARRSAISHRPSSTPSAVMPNQGTTGYCDHTPWLHRDSMNTVRRKE